MNTYQITPDNQRLADLMKTLRDSSTLSDDAAAMFYHACDVIAQEWLQMHHAEYTTFMRACGASTQVRCQLCDTLIETRLHDALVLPLVNGERQGYCGCEDEEETLTESEDPRVQCGCGSTFSSQEFAAGWTCCERCDAQTPER